ncbi:MAG: dihydroorotate dehydrogenase [Clostridiales bacterium]
MSNVKLETEICGVKFKNPVIAASGTFGFGKEFGDFIDLNLLGGISVKGITVEKRDGNPPPRIAETPSGILNSVGLQNPGLDKFIKKEIPFLNNFDTKTIVNISGNLIEDYCIIAEKLSSEKIDMLELNVSCPNVKKGCLQFGNSANGIYDIVSKVKKYCKQPLIVKLTPNVTDIKEIALSAQEAGADAISLINTLLGMAIDINTKKPILKNNFGGLSGPAIKPIALRMTYEVANSVNIPVIGMGGIVSGDDAIEFLLAGASAVMVGTYNFVTPTACIDVLHEIESYLENKGYNSIHDIIGKLELNYEKGGCEI